jgi:GNAT superfamily N-acetyltransferase
MEVHASVDVEVRVARTHEIEGVLAMFEWLFAAPGSVPPHWDPAEAAGRLERLLDNPRATLLVADTGATLAGFVTVFLDIDSVRYGQRAWVEDLAVDPARRSTGIGKRLLDAAKEWGRARGASHLELDSGLARLDAHRFYEREGPSWKSICFAWEL